MNVEQTTARLTDTSDTHISDSWLRLSRILWSTCLLLGVGLFVGGLPTYFASLHQVISSVNLNDLGAQLTPQDVKALHAVSLSLDVYACPQIHPLVGGGLGRLLGMGNLLSRLT